MFDAAESKAAAKLLFLYRQEEGRLVLRPKSQPFIELFINVSTIFLGIQLR